MSKYPKNTLSNPASDPALGLYLLPRGLGLLLGAEMFQLWPDLHRMYGPTAILSEDLLAPQHENYLFAAHKIAADLTAILPESLHPIHLLAALYLAACLGMLLGRKDKICTLLLLVLHHSFFLANYSWSYGVDYLAQIGLYFSLLFGGTKAITSEHQRWTQWGRILFGIQLTSVYLFAGLGKAMGKTWWNGEAIWKALQQPFGQVIFAIPESYHRILYLWIILGWATVLLETGYVLAWLHPILRKVIVYSTIALHLGILVSLGLTHFTLLMIWYNCCVWILPYTKLAKPIINTLERDQQQATGSML